MSDFLQKIEHKFPENIDASIDNFKKQIVSKKQQSLFTTLSKSIQIHTHKNNLVFDLYQSMEEQVKKTLGLPDKKLLGLTINKKLKSYNHFFIIQSFKAKLTSIQNSNTENDEDINMTIFSIINNLALYLSCSGNFISRQDYEEMDNIIKSKGTKFTIGVLGPQLAGNIDKNTSSTENRGKKYIKVNINIPSLNKKVGYNNENTPTLTKLSEVLIQNGNKTLLPLVSQLSEIDPIDINTTREKIIKSESVKFKGYYSIGGKIHFKESIPKEKVDEFEKKFGFQSTGFKLIHANKSLLLPPSCSPNILLFYILALEKFGLIDGEPDLQLSIPGRLPNRAAGILGSITLLSGETHTEYTPEAFSTNQDNLTGARIMAYDDGVLDNKFKHNSSSLKGRTDMLGIVDINKVYNYHFLGSILSQTFYGGKHSKIGKEFIKEYIKILEKYNLQQILQEEWIYDKSHDNHASANQHYNLIKKITDTQKHDREQFLQTNSKDGLIIFEIKNLLNKYKESLKYRK